MAIMMVMEWPGVGIDQYEEIRRTTNFESDVPGGSMFHVAAPDGDDLRVVDVWDTADSFNQFVETRLMPVVQQMGVTSQPTIQILPVHNIFSPAYTPR